MAGIAGELLEQAGKMKLGKACDLGQTIGVDFLIEVVGDIVADLHEFRHVLLPLVLREFPGVGDAVDIGPSDIGEEFQKPRPDHGSAVGGILVIFPDDIAKKLLKLLVQRRIRRLRDQKVGLNRLHHLSESAEHFQKIVVKKNENTLAAFRRGIGVNGSGRDDQNIARHQNILFRPDLYGVILLNGIENLDGRVPVRWKMNGIPVVIQADSLNFGIFDLLTDSVEVRIKLIKRSGIVAV